MKFRFGLAFCALIAFASLASAASVVTLNSNVEDIDGGYTHPSILEDAAGNIHVLTKFEYDETVEYGWGVREVLAYYMTDKDGDILIDQTVLMPGTWVGRGELGWVDPSDESKGIAVLYHQTEGEILLGVIDPSQHPQDGTDANATVTAPVADGGNTGDGTFEDGKVWTGALTTRTENWTVEWNNAVGVWEVTGSVSGLLADMGQTDSPFPMTDGTEEKNTNEANKVAFRINAGGAAFVDGDKFTFSTTASPILTLAADMPISNDDAIESVHGKFLNLPNGDLMVIWREGSSYNDDTTNQSLGFRTGDPAKALGSIDFVFDSGDDGDFEDYGGGDVEVAADGNGVHTTVVYTPDTDDEVSHLTYFVFDPSDASYKVEPSFLFIHEEVKRSTQVVLPDGKVLIAFQAYLNDPSQTELFYAVIDPSVNGYDGSSLNTESTATADGGNTGDGELEELTVSMVAPAGNYTVTCIDDSVAGSETWSVEDDTDAVYEDATTGARYYTDSGALTFIINAGATDFAVGDEFTFTVAANPALLSGPDSFDDADGPFQHPHLSVNPDGKGILMVFNDQPGTSGDQDPYYALFGYDGSLLSGPTKLSDIDQAGSDNMEWPYDIRGSFVNGQVIASWNEYDSSESGYRHQLALEDSPVDAPIIDSVSPASFDEGTETTLTVDGDNFVDGAAVFLGETELASVTFVDAQTLEAVVPETTAPGTYDVRVVNPDTLFDTEGDAVEILSAGDDDSDDDADDDTGDDDAGGDDDAADDDAGDDDDDDDDDGCCGC